MAERVWSNVMWVEELMRFLLLDNKKKKKRENVLNGVLKKKVFERLKRGKVGWPNKYDHKI